MDCIDVLIASAAMLAAIAAVTGLLVASRQLRAMHRAARSEAYSVITGQLLTLDNLIAEDPSLMELLEKDPQAIDKQERTKQEQLALMWLDLYENAHFQWKEGVIPDKLWDPGWREQIRRNLRRQGFNAQYRSLHHLFNKDFRSFMKGLSDESE